MKRKFVTIILLFLTIYSQAQQLADQDWNAFSQSFDATPYQGGQFRFKGFVKAENTNKVSHARLWARVDKKKGAGFFDNMNNRPILSNEWKEYLIEGDIDENAIRIIIGGLYFGTGKYYFDKFSLEVKSKHGDWQKLKVPNSGFEDEPFDLDWKSIYIVKGFESRLTSEDSFEGKSSLLVDGSSRNELSKFIDVNGINIHYQEQGKGDTILLLHGNGESLKSFSKQIPELSKYFYVIAIDSRGQGYSTEDGKQLTYELMAEDVNAFLDKLKVKEANILGWSDGGNIGLILAMKHPEKVEKLAVMGANLYNDKTSVDEKINSTIIKERSRLLTQNNSDNKFKIALIDLLLNEPKINPDDLTKITCPTLVMAGSKDVIKEEHTKLIASKIDKSKLVIFDKGTHYEPIENPERFNKTVIEFFRDR